jgi:protein-S-isoprenylcysteine O-methyltransferase Ste14
VDTANRSPSCSAREQRRVILTVIVVCMAASNVFTVPREERNLEARLGEAGRDDRRRIPRRLGRIHRQ